MIKIFTDFFSQFIPVLNYTVIFLMCNLDRVIFREESSMIRERWYFNLSLVQLQYESDTLMYRESTNPERPEYKRTWI